MGNLLILVDVGLALCSYHSTWMAFADRIDFPMVPPLIHPMNRPQRRCSGKTALNVVPTVLLYLLAMRSQRVFEGFALGAEWAIHNPL